MTKDKLSDQYLSSLLDTLKTSNETRVNLNEGIDFLKITFDEAIANVVSFAETQPAENQAKILEFKTLLQIAKN